jgi:hypothetical protein
MVLARIGDPNRPRLNLPDLAEAARGWVLFNTVQPQRKRSKKGDIVKHGMEILLWVRHVVVGTDIRAQFGPGNVSVSF